MKGVNMESMTNPVAENLAELRERRVLTIAQLANMSGVAPSTINEIELGHRKARPSTLRKLARAFGIHPEDFYKETDLPKAPGPSPTFEETGRRSDDEILSLQRGRRALSRLQAFRYYLDCVARRWEAETPTPAQVRDVLDAVRPYLELQAFQLDARGYDRRDGIDAAELFELEMLAKAIARLQVAADKAEVDAEFKRLVDGVFEEAEDILEEAVQS
jgi:transcriptional regulator with XRE-family HTH domain